jgi:flagellar hook-length control protein FliK
MVTALLVAPGMPSTAPQTAGNPGARNDSGADGAFSSLLGSLLGRSAAQAGSDAGAATDVADQDADQAKNEAADDSVNTLLMALISLLSGQLQDGPASQFTADGSPGNSPAAAAGSLSSLIGQIGNYLDSSGSGGQFAGDLLAALNCLTGEATAAAPHQDILAAGLNDLDGAALQATGLPEAAPTVSDRAEPATPGASAAAVQIAADRAALAATAGDQAQLANGLAGGAAKDPGTAGNIDNRPARQTWPALTGPSGSQHPAATGRAQTAESGSGPVSPSQTAAGDAPGSPASATGGDLAASMPEHSAQASGMTAPQTAPPGQTQDEAAPLKLAEAPPAQQAEAASPQAPSVPGEMRGVLTQPPLQQPDLSLSAAGQAREASQASGQLEAGLIGQIVDNARLVANSSSASMKIRLKPEFLGDLNLVVRVERGVVNAHFIAQNQDTANLIQNQLPELKQALDDQGISWQHLSVSSGGSQGGHQGASGQAQQHAGQFYPQPAYGCEGDAGLDEPPAAAVYQWTGSGTFNYVI